MNYQEIALTEAVSCFGMERVSLSADSNSFYIIIQFPEFTISNGTNSHFITDMYVRLKMNLTNGRFQGLAGTRTVVTPEENNSQYLQSHIHRSTTLGVFDEFCTGNGIITDLKSSLAQGFDQDRLSLLFFSLPEMVAWESKDGVPYITINDISMRNAAPTSISIPDLDYIVKLFKTHANLKYDYAFTDCNTKVSVEIPKEQIEEVLTPLLLDKPQYYVEKVGTQYFRIDTGNNHSDTIPKGFTSWQFNGKNLPMMIRSLKETSSTAIKTIHPYLSKQVYEEVSKKYKEFLEKRLS